jgi:hypothetical protein
MTKKITLNGGMLMLMTVNNVISKWIVKQNILINYEQSLNSDGH